jgi:hypothetical protein
MKNLLMIISAALFMFSCGGGECEKEGKCCKDGDKKECHKDGYLHGDKEHACKPGCKKACCAKKEEAKSDSSASEEEVVEEGLTDEDAAIGAAVHTVLTK